MDSYTIKFNFIMTIYITAANIFTNYTITSGNINQLNIVYERKS